MEPPFGNPEGMINWNPNETMSSVVGRGNPGAALSKMNQDIVLMWQWRRRRGV